MDVFLNKTETIVGPYRYLKTYKKKDIYLSNTGWHLAISTEVDELCHRNVEEVRGYYKSWGKKNLNDLFKEIERHLSWQRFNS